MAERRKSGRATDDEELDREALTDDREPPDQDEQEAPGGVEPEPSGEGEPRLADEDEPRLADEGEPRLADEGEPRLADENEPRLADEDEPGLADEDESSANGRGTRRGRPAHGLTASEAAKTAMRQIVELTAKRAEGITRVQRTEDGWLIGVEVVEDRRIPSSADILATYEADIDADGELMSYQRVRRYARGRGDSSEES
jgi:hypothetical protein